MTLHFKKLFTIVLTFLTLASLLTSSLVSADVLFKPEHNCSRSYIYKNRTYNVDSSRKQDAEGLRTIFKKGSESESLLNQYQNSLKSANWPAFTGTLGVALIVGGTAYSGLKENPLGKRDTRNVSLYSGIALIAGSYLFGQWSLSKNEKRLEKAVNFYNDAAPETEKIRVGLNPSLTGDGGEIKTEVPF